MDGIHDLGGRQGFGTINVHETEVPFHEPWEARVLGIVRAMSPAADWNIDWFRHCRELIEPVDYLTRPYFDQWLQTYAAMPCELGYRHRPRIDGRASDIAPFRPSAADESSRRQRCE